MQLQGLHDPANLVWRFANWAKKAFAESFSWYVNGGNAGECLYIYTLANDPYLYLY